MILFVFFSGTKAFRFKGRQEKPGGVFSLRVLSMEKNIKKTAKKWKIHLKCCLL